jgi:hypothetical protein
MPVGDTINRFGTLARSTMSQILQDRAFSVGKDITAVRYTKTLDTFGQASAVTTSSYSIIGDLQLVTADDHELIEQGFAQIGDAFFYTYDSSALSTVPKEGDQLIFDNSDRWEIVNKDKSPKVGNFEVHSVWYCRRRDQTGDTDSF